MTDLESLEKLFKSGTYLLKLDDEVFYFHAYEGDDGNKYVNISNDTFDEYFNPESFEIDGNTVYCEHADTLDGYEFSVVKLDYINPKEIIKG